MVLAEGQISISRPGGASVTLHHGTVYKVTEFEPFERGVRADQGGAIAWGNGEWSGVEWRASPTVTMKLSLRTRSWAELMAAWWAVEAAVVPVETGPEVEIRWNAAGVEYLMYARPRRSRLHNKNLRTGKGKGEAEFFCPDPLIYSGVEHSVEMGLLYRTGGFSVPVRIPFRSHAVVAGGEVPVVNAGIRPAKLLLRINGPVPAPRVSVVTDTTLQTIYLDTVLGANDYLDIDTQKKTVLLNGVTTRLADQFGDWPVLPPGPARIRFESDHYGDAARLSARWRDTN